MRMPVTKEDAWTHRCLGTETHRAHRAAQGSLSLSQKVER